MQLDDHALLSAILKTAVDAIIVIDRYGIMQSVNPATSKLFGYPDEEMLGKNVKMLMPSPYHQEHDGYLDQYHKTGRATVIGVGREAIGRRKDDSTFPMHLAVSEVMLGDVKLFVGIVRDTSDLKAAQAQLTLANEKLEERVRERTEALHAAQADLAKAEKLATLGQITGGIAHEIRNPLHAIRTSAYYLLHARNPSAEKTTEHLERIDRQVSIVDNVITAVSDIARLPDPRVDASDVREIIEQAIETVSIPELIKVENEVNSSLPPVSVDPSQIAIVFRNLLRNAREAMPEGGTIRLVSREQADTISIDVIDDGIGIDSVNLQRVLEPLFTTKVKGMGLGLSVSAAIIHKNRGKLEVQSQVGVGTTFTVHLPVYNPPPHS